MFVDASALVAILAREPEGRQFTDRLLGSAIRLTSAMAMWEAAFALARTERTSAAIGLADLQEFAARTRITVVSIGAVEALLAVEIRDRFCKGRHPARLNMGDCFAYACARIHGVPLLYKGDDFALTDIAAA